MPTIFISYRRSDAPGHAGRLYDRLVDRFGPGSVFKDLDSLEPGADFEEIIEATIEQCDAVVAVIGRDWLSSMPDGRRRLDDPQDWVRLELRNALRRRLRIIPVLVEGARMPSPTDLPSDIRALTRRHAVEMGEATWSSQVTQLIDTLERSLDANRGAPKEAAPPRLPAPRRVDPTDEQAAWKISVARPSARERVLQLRIKGAEHVLTVRAGVWAYKVTLDGARVAYEPGDSGPASSIFRFTLTHPLGETTGVLRVKTKGATGPLDWLTLDLDDQRVYGEGDQQ